MNEVMLFKPTRKWGDIRSILNVERNTIADDGSDMAKSPAGKSLYERTEKLMGIFLDWIEEAWC